MLEKQLDPRIGMLNSGKFYCFPDGNGKPEFIGTLEEVEVKLGLRSPKKKQGALRRYCVTVTPKIITYGSHGANGEYTIEVFAASHSNAITKVRQERNETEGRYGVRASYRAKLLAD